MKNEGLVVPRQIGTGRFAKVYAAWQKSGGRNVRPVAIKVLHYASRSAERLFEQEIRLLETLNTVSSVNVISTLDILSLRALVLCGCGQLYEPRYPRGCGLPLARRDGAEGTHPALACG